MKSVKFTALLPLLAICIAFTSCESDEVLPSDGDMTQNISMNASSGATVDKNSYEIDISKSYMFTDCENYPLRTLSGIWRGQLIVVQNKNNVNVHSNSTISNIKLLNEATGAIYTGSYSSNITGRYYFPTYPPLYHKETNVIVLTTSGEGNNLKIRADLLLEIDKDGNIIRLDDKFSSVCQ